MAKPKIHFVSEQRRIWMRRRDHTVVFDRDPDFARFLSDPHGSVLHIIRIWVAAPESEWPKMRHYVGSARYWEGVGWLSHRDLRRLYRRATLTARHLGEDARGFRTRLSGYLRRRFGGHRAQTGSSPA